MSGHHLLTGKAREIADAKALKAAHDRELSALLADLPDPREYAYSMPAELAEALMCATRRQHGVWFLPRDIAPALRPFGLCDYPTNALTAFGCAVLRELREQDA